MPDLRVRILAAGLFRAFQVSLSPDSAYCETEQTRRRDAMNTQFQFRLNGVIMTHMKVRPVAIAGTTNSWDLVACHETLGEFAIDDNEGLVDTALARFILEMRDASIPPIERRYLPNKGWKMMTTGECLTLLESGGVIGRR